MRVLNVGGGSHYLPDRYAGWNQTLLDIDPKAEPEICLDALEILTLPGNEYDSVYCSHTLEHFYKHDVPKVLNGFYHVLKEDGVADIIVPSLPSLVQNMASGNNLDIDDVWYRTSVGLPITFHDVLYGWGEQMDKGNLYFAHKCGFSKLSLAKVLRNAGFLKVNTQEIGSNIFAVACKKDSQ